jgi:glycerophosphoryl diester phosphodiesterase
MKRIIGRIALTLLVVAVFFAIYRLITIKPRPYKAYVQTSRPLVMAHQGGADLAPSNTMAAFRNAAQMGVDVLELDVHTTKDGVVVVIHDATVDRTTNGTGRVHDLALSDLQKLDAGYQFSTDNGQTFPFRGQGVTIPTLQEVLAAFPALRINIEIKQADPPMEQAVADLIQQAGAQARVLVVASNSDVIERFRALMPEVATGASESEVRSFFYAQTLRVSALYRPTADALQVPENFGNIQVLSPHFVQAAHARDVAVHAWTINDVESMRRLLDMGIDGIITDRPDLALEVLGRKTP